MMGMNNHLGWFLFSLALLIGGVLSQSAVQFWLTTGNQSALFEPQKDLVPFQTNQQPVIQINPQTTYQEIDGFGWALTGGSATVMYALPSTIRAQLLQELFGNTSRNIGTSFLRLTLGASDLSADVFSYDDISQGSTDPNLDHFSLSQDLQSVVPLLKEILQINPKIKLLSCPWSAPLWMKTDFNAKGGSLADQWMGAYASYFVKYIQAMQAQGIPIYAITPQNEPLNPNNNPSLYMDADNQKTFIRDHLGPAFKAANLQTKIIVYDHNADRIDYPIDILSDSQAAQYVDGSAFHLYGGQMSALSTVHDKFPDKGLYFTEFWLPAPENKQQFASNLIGYVKSLIVDGTRNWCKTVILWNLATDQNWGPHTCCGGCTTCLGALTITNGTHQIQRSSGYYTIAHASRFVVPGSVRIESTLPNNLPNTAFKGPDGKIILVLGNTGSEQVVTIKVGQYTVNPTIPAGAVATLIWSSAEEFN